MKRFILSIGVLCMVCLATQTMAQAKAKIKEEKVKIKDDTKKMKMKAKPAMDMDYPYKAEYSSDFEIGDPAHAKSVLQLWKDFDDNTLDRNDMFADSIVMQFADGYMMRGKDSVMAGAKAYRASLTSVSSQIDAWVPLYARDRDQHWVAIWGVTMETKQDGTTEKMDVQEIWQFNEDGKVVFMKQFAAKPMQEQ